MKKMSFIDFINESAIDIPRNSLDPTVFQFPDDSPPILQPSIKNQILNDINNLKTLIPIETFFIIGSILTKNFNRNSDIDITIKSFKEDIDLLDISKIIETLNFINGRLAIGTTHPINYYIITDEYDFDKTEAAYDIISDSWIKEPKTFDFNINTYLNKFQNELNNIDLTSAELRRDIIDLDELNNLSPNEIKNIRDIIRSKLYEIESNIKKLIEAKDKIKKDRKDIYKKQMSPDEIIKYGNKNNLPENILYKLLHKYYYWNFIEELNKLFDESGNKIDQQAVEKIKKTFKKDLWKEKFSFIDYLIYESVNIKVKKVDWKNPKAIKNYKAQKIDRPVNRKNLRQVPAEYSKEKQKYNKLGSSRNVIETAKKTKSGLWKISLTQVKEISNFYNFKPPTKEEPTKHLGNTGIYIFRRKNGDFFLIKN